MGRKSTVNQYLNKKIGGITILAPLQIRNRRLWVKCQCLFCNKEFEAQFHNVYKGNYKSCGCLQYLNNKNNRKWQGFGEISLSYFNRIREGAISRKLAFNITIEYIWELFLKQKSLCALSGLPIRFPQSRIDYSSTASLDRIDSTIGYEEGNIQWVHKDINFMKQDLPETKFLEYCHLIIKKTNHE